MVKYQGYLTIILLTIHTEIHRYSLPTTLKLMVCSYQAVSLGTRKTDIELLTSSQSKRGIWRLYQRAMIESQKRAAAYTTFCRLWNTLLPAIVVMKLISDLCWTCQQHSAGIQRATMYQYRHPEVDHSASKKIILLLICERI